MNEVTYTYKRTKEDFLAHTIWHRFFKSPLGMIMNFVFPVIALFLLIASFFLPTDPVVYIAYGYLLVLPFLNYYLIKLRINRMFQNPELQIDETTFTYTETGVKTASERGELELEWIYIKNVYVVKDYIYVYVDRINSFLINKNHVGEQNIKTILELFEKHLPKGTVKYRKKSA